MFLFRAQAPYKDKDENGKEIGEDIWYKNGMSINCKKPNNDYSVAMHIMHGSDLETKYISTTRALPVAVSYMYDCKNKNPIIDSEPVDMLLIDTDKFPKDTKVYDLLDDNIDQDVLKDIKKLDMALNYATSSQEVIIENQIPATSIKRIPNLYVKMLNALSMEGNPASDAITQAILKMVSNDDKTIIDEIFNEKFLKKLSNPEINLLSCLQKSGKDAMSVRDIASEIFKDSSDESCMTVQALTAHTIRNIVNSQEFKGIMFNYILDNGIENIMEKPKILEKFAPSGKLLDEKYFECVKGNVSRRTTSEYSKLYKVNNKSNAIEQERKRAIFITNNTTMEMPKDNNLKDVRFAYDANIREDGNVEAQLLQVDRDEKSTYNFRVDSGDKYIVDTINLQYRGEDYQRKISVLKERDVDITL